MDSILNKTITFLRNNDNLNEECVIASYGFELLLLKMIFTTAVLWVDAYTLDYSQISCSAILLLY